MSQFRYIHSVWPASTGDGSTLSIDFTTGTMPSGFTFLRNSSASYITSAGLVAFAAADQPRFTYSGGECLGIMIEGGSANQLFHSETFRLSAIGSEQFWSDSASMSRGTETGPDGVTASAVSFTATGSAQTVTASAAIASSAQRTLSFWARRTGGGSLEYTLDGTAYTSLNISGSWTRYTIASTTAAQRVGFRVATGNATAIWGVQLEAGDGSTSYMRSTSSQGARIGERCYMNSISALNYSTTNGTILFTGIITQGNALSYPTRVGFVNASDDIAFDVGVNGTTFFARAFGTSGAPEATRAFSLNTALKFAVSFDASLSTAEVKAVVNGGSVGSSASSSLTSTRVADRFSLGRVGYEPYLASGTIASVKYWNTTKTSAELQTLTA